MNNKRRYIGNVELNDNYISDNEENENICFDEVKPLFEKCIENIEIIPEEKKGKSNKQYKSN